MLPTPTSRAAHEPAMCGVVTPSQVIIKVGEAMTDSDPEIFLDMSIDGDQRAMPDVLGLIHEEHPILAE